MQILLILFLLISSSIFAYPCPNGGIVYKDDSIEDVIKQCGQPISKQTRIQKMDTLQSWIYYRTHPFDPGYSELVISFVNNIVSKIHINEKYTLYQCRQALIQIGNSYTTQLSCGNWSYDTSYTQLCGYGFGIGDSLQVVLNNCGVPVWRENLISENEEMTELTYDGNDLVTFIFKNGKLVDWRD